MTKTTLEVDGMMCGMCESHVNEAIRKALDVKKVREVFTRMNKWCSFRNEVIHAFMNKNTESLYSGLADRISEGMVIARDFDNLVKKIKRSRAIRKTLNLK